MSSLRSSRGYSSVTLDRLRYGSSSGPGVLAVGIDGVVGPTGTANLQSLNVSGTAVIDTAVINTLVIDDVEFRTVTIEDVQAKTIEISSTGTVNYLIMNGFTGGTGSIGHLTVNTITGLTGSIQNLSVGTLTGATGTFQSLTADIGYIQNLTVGGLTGATGYIQNLTTGAITSTNGSIQNLTVGGITGTTGYIQNLTTVTGAIQNLSVGGITGTTGYIQNLSVGGLTGAVGYIQNLSVGGIVGATGTFSSLTVNDLVVTNQIIDNNQAASYSANYIAGVKLRAGDESAANAAAQTPSLYVVGDAVVTGGATAGYFSTTGAITGGSLSAGAVYTDAIYPFPIGSTGIISLTSGVSITNDNTIEPTKVTSLAFSQKETGNDSNVTAYLVGTNSSGFGNSDNDKEQFCWYSYPKPASGGGVYKVESTPLKTGIVGPAGVTGAVCDKYFYGSVQVRDSVYGATGAFQNVSAQNATVSGVFQGNTGSFQNMTVNGLLTINGSLVYGVQVI